MIIYSIYLLYVITITSILTITIVYYYFYYYYYCVYIYIALYCCTFYLNKEGCPCNPQNDGDTQK